MWTQTHKSDIIGISVCNVWLKFAGEMYYFDLNPWNLWLVDWLWPDYVWYYNSWRYNMHFKFICKYRPETSISISVVFVCLCMYSHVTLIMPRTSKMSNYSNFSFSLLLYSWISCIWFLHQIELKKKCDVNKIWHSYCSTNEIIIRCNNTKCGMMCVWLTCENESWSWDVVSVVLHSSKCLRSLPAFKTCCKSHLSLCTFWAKTRAKTTIHILQFSIMFLNYRKSWHQHRLFISFIIRNLDFMLNLWSKYTIIHH